MTQHHTTQHNTTQTPDADPTAEKEFRVAMPLFHHTNRHSRISLTRVFPIPAPQVLFKEIEEIKHEVLLGKFRLRYVLSPETRNAMVDEPQTHDSTHCRCVLKDKTKELTRLQSLLTTDTKDLKNMEEGATIEYFPAVSMSRS
jgi:hypothetical protein